MDWPPYTYVPGGPFPHPIRDPNGHLHGRAHDRPPKVPDERSGLGSDVFDFAKRLWNAGYYWEAHEAWESLWHAHGRSGPTADLLKGLIKLAAAGVKVREHQLHGVQSHATRAGGLFESVSQEVGPLWLGMDLDRLKLFAEEVGTKRVLEPFSLDLPVVRVFSFVM